MPETTLHLDDQMIAWKDDVRSPCHPGYVETEAVA